MLGGYQILDLRSIDLSRGTSESSISDASVLAQLLNIRDHIQKTYDFSKPLHNQLKPLLIRYRDKKVGEKHEVALYGNIEVINVYYKFRIVANNEGEQLTINVEFEEKTDEYDNKYWSIKTAKILLTSEVAIFENIIDKDGNKRFIEGDIELYSTVPEGITKLYGKWSLSGSHLLIVLAFSVSDTTQFAGTIAQIPLPEWIREKLIAIFSNAIDFKPVNLFANNLSSQSVGVYLRKVSDTVVDLYVNTFTASADRVGRIAFDLLIDNE